MGAGASGQGGFARPRKACWRVFAARRKQALRGGRVRPPGLCLGVAHPRYRGSRAFTRRRGLAGHALMPIRGGRPSGARAISRPFLGGGAIFSRLGTGEIEGLESCLVRRESAEICDSSRSHILRDKRRSTATPLAVGTRGAPRKTFSHPPTP